MTMFCLFLFSVLVSFPSVIDTQAATDDACISASPINIPNTAEVEYKAMTQFKLEGFADKSGYNTTLKKVADGIQIDVEGEVYVTGGGSKDKYKTIRVEMEMDNSTKQYYDGRQYPMQVFIISYNTKYGNTSFAGGKPDGFSVIGFWIVEVKEHKNMDWQPMIDNLEHLNDVGAKKQIENLSLKNLFPQYLQKFYQYRGKLDAGSPSCDSTWSIMNHRLQLAATQIQELRDIFPVSQNTDFTVTDAPAITRNFKLKSESAAAPLFRNIVMTFSVALLVSYIHLL